MLRDAAQQLTGWLASRHAGRRDERRRSGGLPVPPVSADQVAPALQRILDSLAPDGSRLVIAQCDGVLARGVGERRCPGFPRRASRNTRTTVCT
jgi:hypothetical protein